MSMTHLSKKASLPGGHEAAEGEPAPSPVSDATIARSTNRTQAPAESGVLGMNRGLSARGQRAAQDLSDARCQASRRCLRLTADATACATSTVSKTIAETIRGVQGHRSA